jgi:geranylgeranyl diphosphate synthase, type II
VTSAPPGTSDRSDPACAAFLERERRRVEEALDLVAAGGVLGLPPDLAEPVAYALSTTGKRIRPILCIAAYAAADAREQLPAALYRMSCALEIVHTYSLVHDDLPCMDDDDLRRGRPTVHRVYGVRRATLAAAALLPLAMETLDRAGETLGLTVAERAALVIELARAAGAEGMVGGQLLDLEAERRPIDGHTLESIHRRKTGSLLVSSLRIGALAARADGPLLAALTAYGRSLGLAFQIADDLLDVEGDSSSLGKLAGRDLALSKASYPALYGREGARALARLRVEEAKAALAAYDLPHLGGVADFVIERRT